MDTENICQPSGSVVEQNVIDFLAHRKSATKFIHGNTYEVEERGTEVAHYSRMQPPPGKRSFLCTTCGQSFLDYADLEIHSRVCEKIEVIGKKTFSCSLCGNAYENLNHLEIHMKVQHLDHHTSSYSERVKDIRYNEYVSSTHNLTQLDNITVEIVSTSAPNNDVVINENDVVINEIDENKIVTVIDAPREEIEKGGKLYKCSVCGLSNDVTANLYKHMKTMHPEFRIVHKSVISKQMKDEKSQSVKSRKKQNSEDLTAQRTTKKIEDHKQMSEETAKDLLGENFNLSYNVPQIPFLYQCPVCDQRFHDETECSNHFKTHKGKSVWDYSIPCQNDRNLTKSVNDLINQLNDSPQQVNKDSEPKQMHTEIKPENSLCFVQESNKSLSDNEITHVNDEISDKHEENFRDNALLNDHDEENFVEDNFSYHVEQTSKTVASNLESGNMEKNTVETYCGNDVLMNERSLDISKDHEFDKSQEKSDSPVAAKDSRVGMNYPSNPDMVKHNRVTVLSILKPVTNTLQSHGVKMVNMADNVVKCSNVGQEVVAGTKNGKSGNSIAGVGQEVVAGTKNGKSGNSISGVGQEVVTGTKNGNSISGRTNYNIVKVVNIPPIGNHRYKCSACDMTSRSTSNLYLHMKSVHKYMKIVKRRPGSGQRSEYSCDNHGKGTMDSQIGVQGVEKSSKIAKLIDQISKHDPRSSLNADFDLDLSFYDIECLGKSSNQRTVRIIANPDSSEGNKYMCSRCFLSSSDTNTLYQHMETEHKDLTVIQVRKKTEQTNSSSSRRTKKFVRVIDVNEGSHRYKCSACIRTSNSSGNLYDHMRRVHKGYKIVLRRGKDGGADDDGVNIETDVNNEVDEEADDMIHVIDIPTLNGNFLHQCSECHFTCKEISNMYKHMRRKHADMKIAQRIRKKKRSANELAQFKKRKYVSKNCHSTSKTIEDRFAADRVKDFHKRSGDDGLLLAQCKKRKYVSKNCHSTSKTSGDRLAADSEKDYHRSRDDDGLLCIIDNFDSELGCRQYTCSKCDKSFSDTSSAHKHMAVVHRGMEFIHKIKMSNGDTITQRTSARRSVLDKSKIKSNLLKMSENSDGNSDIDNSDSDPEWIADSTRSKRERQHSLTNHVKKKTHKAGSVVQRKKRHAFKSKSKKRLRKSRYLSEDSDDSVSDTEISEEEENLDSSDMPFASDGVESNDDCGDHEGDEHRSVDESSDTVNEMDVSLTKGGQRLKLSRSGMICNNASKIKKYTKRVHKGTKIIDGKREKKSKLSELSREDRKCISENDCDLLMSIDVSGSDEESNDKSNRDNDFGEYSDASPNSDVDLENMNEEGNEGTKKIQVKGVTMFKMIPPANKIFSQTKEDEVVENTSNVFQSNKKGSVFQKTQKSRSDFSHLEDSYSDDENTVRVIDIPETKGGHRFKCSKCDAISRDSSNLNKHMRRMHKNLRIVYRKRGRKSNGKSIKRSKKTGHAFEDIFSGTSETDDVDGDQIEHNDKICQGKDFWEYSFTDANDNTDSFAVENSLSSDEVILKNKEIEMGVKDKMSSKSILMSPSRRKDKGSDGIGGKGKISGTFFIEQESYINQDDSLMEKDVVRAIDISLPGGASLYECSECGLICRNSSNLYKHMKRIHSDMRLIQKQPNRRTVLDESEISAKYLDSDDENQSSDTVRAIEITPTKQGHRFKCSRCNLICRDSSNIKKHMQRMHPGMRILPRKRGRKARSLEVFKKEDDLMRKKGTESEVDKGENAFENESTITSPEQNFWDYFRTSLNEKPKDNITRENKMSKMQRNGVTTLEPVTPEKSSQVAEEVDRVSLLSGDRKFEVVITGSLNPDIVLTPDDVNIIKAGMSSGNSSISLSGPSTQTSTLGGESTLVNSSKGVHDSDDSNSLRVIDLPMKGGLTKYKCSKCDLICNKLSNIYKHMRRMHPDLTMIPRDRKNKAWYQDL